MSNILPEFKSHDLNPNGAQKIDELREAYSTLLATVERLLPKSSRERSVAITELQASSMWATRAVAVQPENQAQIPEAARVPHDNA